MASHPTPVGAAPAWFASLFHPHVPGVLLTPPVIGYRSLALEPVFANDVAAIWAEFVAWFWS